jgi:hypothetical protein
MSPEDKFRYLVSSIEEAKARVAAEGIPMVLLKTVRGEYFTVSELVAYRYVKRGATKILVVQPPKPEPDPSK